MLDNKWDLVEQYRERIEVFKTMVAKQGHTVLHPALRLMKPLL